MCRRCGWRGRRAWTEADIPDPSEYGASTGATVDPALVALDNPPAPVKSKSKKPSRRTSPPKSRTKRGAKAASEFDLSGLQDAFGEHLPPDADPPAVNVTGWDERTRDIVLDRLQRSKRRQIVGSIAISALVLFAFALLSIARSCGNSDSGF